MSGIQSGVLWHVKRFRSSGQRAALLGPPSHGGVTTGLVPALALYTGALRTERQCTPPPLPALKFLSLKSSTKRSSHYAEPSEHYSPGAHPPTSSLPSPHPTLLLSGLTP